MTDTFSRMRQIVGTTEDWNLNNILIGDGEVAYERTTDGLVKYKLGDGINVFGDLGYVTGAVWAVDGNITYTLEDGPVSIGLSVAVDRLTVQGGNYAVGAYRDAILTSGQVTGIFKAGGWTVADTQVAGVAVRGIATEDWTVTASGAELEFMVTPDGTTGLVKVGTVSNTGDLDLNGDTLRLRADKTPASATDTGEKGEIVWDADYIYVCVQSGQWKRAGLSTW